MERRASDIPVEVFQLIQDKLRLFNLSRILTQDMYYILFPTEKSLYYTFWYYNPSASYYPYIFLSNLELNALSSVNKAMRIMGNSYLPLQITDSLPQLLKNGDDIIPFGKYRGRHLQDIYAMDPRYITWIADKYEPKVKSEFRFKELAVTYGKVYMDLQTRRKYKTTTSHFVGKPGDRLDDLSLTITRVRIEDDSYRTQLIQGVEYFYVDQLLTGVDSAGNLFLFTMKATDRSLTSRTLSPSTYSFRVGEEVLLISAKVLKHIESHQVKYTKLGYVKLTGS